MHARARVLGGVLLRPNAPPQVGVLDVQPRLACPGRRRRVPGILRLFGLTNSVILSLGILSLFGSPIRI